jgi:hypothetical protein
MKVEEYFGQKADIKNLIANDKQKCFEKVQQSYNELRLKVDENILSIKPLEYVDFDKVQALMDGTATNRDESFVELLKFCINYNPEKEFHTAGEKRSARFDECDKDFAKHCILSMTLEEYFSFYYLSIQHDGGNNKNVFCEVIRASLVNYKRNHLGSFEFLLDQMMLAEENKSLVWNILFGSNEESLSRLIEYGCEDFLKSIIEQRNRTLKKHENMNLWGVNKKT